jgi:hypothetical protein
MPICFDGRLASGGSLTNVEPRGPHTTLTPFTNTIAVRYRCQSILSPLGLTGRFSIGPLAAILPYITLVGAQYEDRAWATSSRLGISVWLPRLIRPARL